MFWHMVCSMYHGTILRGGWSGGGKEGGRRSKEVERSTLVLNTTSSGQLVDRRQQAGDDVEGRWAHEDS